MVAVITATPPGFNPGMMISEATAKAFVTQTGLSARFFRIVHLADRLTHLGEEERLAVIRRCDTGTPYELLTSMEQLENCVPLFWGDYLHMCQYVRAIGAVIKSGSSEDARKLLLLDGAPMHLKRRAVSFGTTLLFNSASDFLDPSYGTPFVQFASSARRFLARDPISASFVSAARGSFGESCLGSDAAQLVVLPGYDATIFGSPSELPEAPSRHGLAFFARGSQSAQLTGSLLECLQQTCDLEFCWLPWGDSGAFPHLSSLDAHLGLAGATSEGAPSLSTLIAAVRRASVIVTDVYHLAVLGWALGTPAIMTPGSYFAGERDVNAGHFLTRLDKRQVFFAHNGLLEFFLSNEMLSNAETMQLAVRNIRDLIEDGAILEWHRSSTLARAGWSVDTLRAAISGFGDSQ